jgi:Protein of unknown function (DUF3168)
MVESGFAQHVAADVGVQAVIGNPARFYPVLVPESPAYPCGTYKVISDTPSYTLAGNSPLNSMRIQVDTWDGGLEDGSYADAKAAQAAIRDALELYVGLFPDGTRVAGIFVANAHDSYDQDARCFRTSTDYIVNYYPA